MSRASIDVSLAMLALHAAAEWSVICWLCPPRCYWSLGYGEAVAP